MAENVTTYRIDLYTFQIVLFFSVICNFFRPAADPAVCKCMRQMFFLQLSLSLLLR